MAYEPVTIFEVPYPSPFADLESGTYRVIKQAMNGNCNVYVDAKCIWREGVLARIAARYVEWFDRRGVLLAIADADACGVIDFTSYGFSFKPGEAFHWWMLGWWLSWPLVLIDELCPRLDNIFLRTSWQH